MTKQELIQYFRKAIFILTGNSDKDNYLQWIAAEKEIELQEKEKSL